MTPSLAATASRNRWYAWSRAPGAGVAGAVVAGLVMPFVHTGGTVGPARMDVVVRPSLDGDTVIGVPPFGRVLVDSHAAPVEVRATIEELDVPALQRLASKDDIEAELRASAESDVAGLVRWAAIRLIVITALAGAVVGLLLGRRRLCDPATVPLVLALFVAGSLLAQPVQNGISRRIETRADVDALAFTQDPDAFVALQRRLAERSMADPTPPAWSQWWFGSHPTVLVRVALARS